MKAPIPQSSALPGKAQDFAIGAFIGLHGQKLILNDSDLKPCVWMAWCGSLKAKLLNMIFKIEFVLCPALL
jgi:hypothetical protein